MDVLDLHVFMLLYYIYILMITSASYWIVFDPCKDFLNVNK